MVELNATLIAQIINFLILVAILAKFAYKPIMQAMAERQNRIAQAMADADHERAAAAELKREYEEQLKQARTQAQAIVDKAIKLAEQTKEEILEEARQEHTRLLKAAQAEIAREREQALAQMRNEVVTLSLAAAAKIVAQNLDEQANAKLVNEFIEKLDKQKIGGLPC